MYSDLHVSVFGSKHLSAKSERDFTFSLRAARFIQHFTMVAPVCDFCVRIQASFRYKNSHGDIREYVCVYNHILVKSSRSKSA